MSLIREYYEQREHQSPAARRLVERFYQEWLVLEGQLQVARKKAKQLRGQLDETIRENKSLRAEVQRQSAHRKTAEQLARDFLQAAEDQRTAVANAHKVLFLGRDL